MCSGNYPPGGEICKVWATRSVRDHNLERTSAEHFNFYKFLAV
jgi:hypothetical protein